MKSGVEGLSDGLDRRHPVPGKRRQQVSPHELDALQEAVQVPALALLSVVDGAIQVIDRREQILDEILVTVLMGFGALPERPSPKILEVRLKPQELVLGLLELERRILRGRLPLREALRLVPPLGLLHRLGGLAERLLELRARRERPLRSLLGRGLAILGLLGPFDLDLPALLLRAHERSFPVTSSEK